MIKLWDKDFHLLWQGEGKVQPADVRFVTEDDELTGERKVTERAADD